MSVPLDQPVRIAFNTYSDTAGTVAADPTAITLDILDPTGSTTTHNWPGDITRDAVGVFHFNATSAIAGHYAYHWKATGAVATAMDGSFDVSPKYGLASSPLDILTISEAKDAIASNAGANNDDHLALYNTAVSRYLDRVAGAVVIRTITDEALDGLGRSVLALRFRPVVSISSVTEYMGGTSYPLTQQSLGVVTSNGYSADLRNGLLVRGSGAGQPWSTDAWAPGRGNILITYTAGRYTDTASVDERFKLAAAIILGNLWRRERGLGALPDGFLTGATYAMPHAAAALLADDLRPQARSVQMT